MRFWMSWVQPTEDYRPLTFPPNDAVLGWWCSGYDANDDGILCALVEAPSEEAALAALRKDWPELPPVMRFIETRPSDQLPRDRFPLSDWMKARIKE